MIVAKTKAEGPPLLGKLDADQANATFFRADKVHEAATCLPPSAGQLRHPRVTGLALLGVS